jgi:Domain of unknown function (DUF4389)
MSTKYTAPRPSATAGQQAPAPVLVGFAGPARQPRLTVLVRIFMVLPHLVVLAFMGIAAEVVAIIGWFGALFTGRLPGFAADFLTGYLRWHTRVTGYAILLTDVYPPFSLEDADYPIRVDVAPGPLNRLAVLFRLFLMIPALIVQALLGYGAFTIVQLVSWLIMLITGEMPAELYQALAAVVRFQARTLGFGLMLTAAYPAGLFGDPEAAWSPARRSRGDVSQVGYGAEDGRAPSWRLVLSGAARKLVGGFLALGVLSAVTFGVVYGVVLNNSAASINAENRLQADIAPVHDVINNYSTNLTACNGKLPCVASLDQKVAATLTTFAANLRAIPMPSGSARTGAAHLAASATSTANLFAKLGRATSPTQYIKIAKAANLNQSVEELNQEYLLLGGILAR